MVSLKPIYYRRICLFAGANAGKSSMAGFIYSNLKAKDYNIELVREEIKKYIYRSEKITIWDQIPLYGIHVRDEIDCLYKGNVDYLVTDCPTALIATYAKVVKMPGWEHLIELEEDYNKNFPALNIFLDRIGIKFKQEGRIHTAKQSANIDKIIKKNIKDFTTFKFNDVSGICDFIQSKCPNKK